VEAYRKRLKGAKTGELRHLELSGFGRHRHPSHLSLFLLFCFLHIIMYFIKAMEG